MRTHLLHTHVHACVLSLACSHWQLFHLLAFSHYNFSALFLALSQVNRLQQYAHDIYQAFVLVYATQIQHIHIISMCAYIHTCTRWKNYSKTRTTFCSVQPWWIPCAQQSRRICASTGAKVASKTWPIPSGKSRNTILCRPRQSLSISSSLGTTHLSNANYLHT